MKWCSSIALRIVHGAIVTQRDEDQNGWRGQGAQASSGSVGLRSCRRTAANANGIRNRIAFSWVSVARPVSTPVAAIQA